MMFCKHCGQCSHISDANFYQVGSISGWEKWSVDPETGERMDFIDGETDDFNHEQYHCPMCGDIDVEDDSEIEKDEAWAVRREYEKAIREHEKQLKIKKINAMTKDSEWDIT